MSARAPFFGKVQTSPTGLLHLLGMKSSGRQPTLFPESLQPTLNLYDLYRAEHQEWSTHTTAAVTAVGMWGATGSIVPNGELWIAEQISINRISVLAAATTGRFRLAIYEANTTTPMAISPTSVSAAAGEIPTLGWDGPIYIKAGYGIAVIAEALTLGTAPTLFVAFRGAKLAV